MAKLKKNVVKMKEEQAVDAAVNVQSENGETYSADIDKMTPEQIEAGRQTFKKNFNERFSKWAEIEDEPADDEYIAQCKKDFDDEVELNKNRKFLIAEATDGLALKTAEFLKTVNAEANAWAKGSWRGVIMFDRVISKHIEELKADAEKNFEIDYTTLIFLHQTMMAPYGVGLKEALRMAEWENYNPETDEPYETEMPVTYSGVLEKILNYVNELSAIDKKLVILRERWLTANAGLRTKLKVSTLEEFVEYSNAVVASDVNAPTE